MKQLSSTSARATRWPGTSLAWVALCVVLLQLAGALHFALVPHAFGAGLSGFVHVHTPAGERVVPGRLELGRPSSAVPTLVSGSACCASDSCPMGFAGPHSLFLGESEVSTVLVRLPVTALAPTSPYFTAPSRVLLSAPKTSPPV